jgi:hypothetical protein
MPVRKLSLSWAQQFGHFQTNLRGYQVWYYEIEVYNPFEEFPAIRG